MKVGLYTSFSNLHTIPTNTMTKNILLNVDEAFFYKMKAYKTKLEKEHTKSYTWEQFIKILFGMAIK